MIINWLGNMFFRYQTQMVTGVPHISNIVRDEEIGVICDLTINDEHYSEVRISRNIYDAMLKNDGEATMKVVFRTDIPTILLGSYKPTGSSRKELVSGRLRYLFSVTSCFGNAIGFFVFWQIFVAFILLLAGDMIFGIRRPEHMINAFLIVGVVPAVAGFVYNSWQFFRFRREMMV